jgi:hypothetical protein
LLQAGGLVAGIVGRCKVASDTCGWEELLAPAPAGLAGAREALVLGLWRHSLVRSVAFASIR